MKTQNNENPFKNNPLYDFASCQGKSKIILRVFYTLETTEDKYNEGEIGPTDICLQDVATIDATLEAVKKLVEDRSGVDFGQASIFGNRLELNVLNNSDNYLANKYEIEKWKAGDLRLWSARYTFTFDIMLSKEMQFQDLTKLMPDLSAKIGE